MNQMEKNIKDLEFVFSEIIRFQSTFNTGDPKALGDEWLHNLSLPSGGIVVIGREGTERIRAVAERALQNEKVLRKKVRIEEFLPFIKNKFVDIFITEKKGVNEKNISKMLSSALKNMKKEFVGKIHFIPCNLFHEAEEELFSVGNITFHHISHFKQIYEKEILDRFRNDNGASEIKQSNNNLIDVLFPKLRGKSPEVRDRFLKLMKRKGNIGLENKYREIFAPYNWIAEIPMGSCHENYSNIQAEYLLESALGLIRLLLSEHYSKKIQSLFFGRAPSELFKLYKLSNGGIKFSHSRSADQELSSGWYNYIFKESKPCAGIFGDILIKLSEFKNLTSLEQKIIDATFCYSQSINE